MNEQLQGLADRYWEYLAETGPTTSLMRGDHRFDEQIEDVSRDAEDAKIEALEGFAASARALDETGLDADERVTRAVLEHDAAANALELRDRFAEFDVNPALGLHAMMLSYVGQFPITEPAHADAMIAKSEGVGRLFRQMAERLRQGIAKGRTPHESAVTKSIAQIDAYLAGPIDADPFVRLRRPEAFDDAADAAWRDRLKEAVENHVRPGFALYRETLNAEVLPKARSGDKVGLCWLPDGEGLYARAVSRHTTLEMTPMDIHRIGMDEIEHLAGEYRDLGSTVLGTSDLAEVLDKLRNDPALRFDTRESIKEGAEAATARAAAAMAGWFGKLPQSPVSSLRSRTSPPRTVPSPSTCPPADDGSRPGTYFINTYEPHHPHPVRVRGARLPRGDPRSPPPDRRSPRSSRACPTFRATDGDRVRRRMGPVHRAPRRRDGSLHRRPRADGHPVVRLVAGGPARRRHRHARPGLEPRTRRSTT